jgi:hypothetical protein
MCASGKQDPFDISGLSGPRALASDHQDNGDVSATSGNAFAVMPVAIRTDIFTG